ncbi:mycothiol transferase [Nocardioides sp. Kera G14]|uniref:mycothiol transferase n=1 Tax=Nocardioides sp. Kera G14 TaxID=2884264 RepID=UPI001D11E759|nr:DinB family protein [Nocardioides sp. Kera G14]UDY24706.1 DinB family protein [Nocardioides sp. Kera G14]
MTPIELLKEAFGRLEEAVPEVVDGLTDEQLTHRVGPQANTIAWLVWHLTRVQDDHIADVAGTEQVWTSQGFARDFDLPFDDAAHGYGQTTEEVGQVRATAEQLSAYFRATYAATVAYLDTLTPEDLDRVVDTRWDPPVTLGVRLVSVVNDDTQHLGQAAFVRGLLA